MRNVKQKNQTKQPSNSVRRRKVAGKYATAAAAVRGLVGTTTPVASGKTSGPIRQARTIPPKPKRRTGPPGAVQRLGQYAYDGGTRPRPSPRPTVNKFYVTPEGIKLPAVVHTSLKSYKDAVRGEKVDAPLAEGLVWHSEPANEFEEVNKDGRRLRISGREFLGQVALLYSTPTTSALGSTGERVLVRPLSPEGIGGRIARLAELYESHHCVRCHITYAPIVPTTKEGALAMGFINDVATSQQLIGLPEMVHLSSAADFVEFPVWRTAELHVDPDRFTREVADEQEGDSRFTTDGLLVVALAGPVDNPGPNDLPVGNLFIEYEYIFDSPLLDQDIITPPTGKLTVSASAAAITTRGFCFAALGPVPGTYATLGLASGLAITDVADYLFSCTIHYVNVTVGGVPQVRVLDDSEPFDLQPGMTIFGRGAVAGSGVDYFMYFFDSLEAASDFVYDQGSAAGAVTSGQLVYDVTSAAGTYQYTLGMSYSAIDITSRQG